MEEKIKINIFIDGIKIPMTIERKEEEIVRAAAKRVDEKINAYRGYYDKLEKDKIYSLAAFDIALNGLKEEEKNNTQPYANKIRELCQMMDNCISENDD